MQKSHAKIPCENPVSGNRVNSTSRDYQPAIKRKTFKQVWKSFLSAKAADADGVFPAASRSHGNSFRQILLREQGSAGPDFLQDRALFIRNKEVRSDSFFLQRIVDEPEDFWYADTLAGSQIKNISPSEGNMSGYRPGFLGEKGYFIMDVICIVLIISDLGMNCAGKYWNNKYSNYG